VRRLDAAAEPWTAQVVVLCDRARIESELGRFGGDERFHLLPLILDGRPCYRICWGSYADSAGARAADGLPPALRALASHPIPKRTDEVAR
jgi:hypothetical protein